MPGLKGNGPYTARQNLGSKIWLLLYGRFSEKLRMTPQTEAESAWLVAKIAGRLRVGIADVERLCAAQNCDEDAAYGILAGRIDDCLAELSSLGVWGEANRLWSSLVWNACEASLARGWLQSRARTKPRGYAGDYELLRWIYERRVSGDPLGRLFDRYFQSQAAPQAVRNRMAMMSDWIVESAASREAAQDRRPLTVAFVGSAVGLEIRDACSHISAHQRQALKVVLIDVDPEAVEFARRQLRGVLDETQVAGMATNLFRLPERPNSAIELSDCDLLFCPGLFDYLSDAAAVRMLSSLYRRLAPGGRLVVFQFAPHNPTRAYMEWFGNWYLTYRGDAEFQRLIESAHLPDAAIAFGTEALGIDLFAAIAKPQLPGS